MSNGHARMSPSRLHRILSCPASFRFSEAIEKKYPKLVNRTSSYADKGTYLHEVMRRILEDGAVLAQFDLTIDDTAAIEDALLYYKNLRNSLEVEIEKFETYVTLDGYDPVLKYVAGTADVVLETRDKLIVIDWKFGAGIEVLAQNNPQLRAYAAGYAGSFRELATYKTVECHVVQPFRENYDDESISAEALAVWLKETLIPGVKEAKSADAKFSPGLETCRFCSGSPYCRHRLNQANEVAQKVFKVRKKLDLVTDDELVEVIKLAPVFERYITEIRAYIQAKLLEGEKVKGFKLVEGRSIRRWSVPEDAVVDTLTKYLDYDEIYNSKLISPAQAEKKSREFRNSDDLKRLVEKPKGKPILAVESDKRPEYSAESVFAEFKK